MNKPQRDTGLDHLFRHQYGRMVSVLVAKYGLTHIESIEDAVQEAFIAALRSRKYPDQPEAWLLRTASNKLIDGFRKNSNARIAKSLPYDQYEDETEVLLDSEVEDSQLRMIFTACNPVLDKRDQIAFALKTISGFSEKEISSALLLKLATVKKRLQRARNHIKSAGITFEIPAGNELAQRLDLVHQVIYLIFIEGFHSGKKEWLIREDLCGEAIRLSRMLLTNDTVANTESYALFALLCFQSARLKSKVDHDHEVISLKDQDRSLWYAPLIDLGNRAMQRAVEDDNESRYHLEAAIAYEHLRAPSYEETNWQRLHMWYERLQAIHPSPLNILNLAVIQLQLEQYDDAWESLQSVSPDILEQRAYLYFGLMAEYYNHTGNRAAAISYLETAIQKVTNTAEKSYLQKKLNKMHGST